MTCEMRVENERMVKKLEDIRKELSSGRYFPPCGQCLKEQQGAVGCYKVRLLMEFFADGTND